MNPFTKQTRQNRAFTIVELLTVMSIIVILIGLLVPALTRVRRYAMTVKQHAQLSSITKALELFNNECEGYPPSGALDGTNQPYCGAMKLCEALMGQDLLGFHANSVFRRDGMDASGTLALYPTPANPDNRSSRKGPYLPAENSNAFTMNQIYGTSFAPFLGKTFVLCDVYERQMNSGDKTGMPILYYKADTANGLHDPNLVMTPTDSKGNIYNYWDNQALVGLGKPWETNSLAAKHRLSEPARFYRNTRNFQVTTVSQPYKADTFILISAGYDNEYGTADDIMNFELKYKE